MDFTDRRTRTSKVLRKLVDEDYADKDRIVLVMDNLNTHHPASLYQHSGRGAAYRPNVWTTWSWLWPTPAGAWTGFPVLAQVRSIATEPRSGPGGPD